MAAECQARPERILVQVSSQSVWQQVASLQVCTKSGSVFKFKIVP